VNHFLEGIKVLDLSTALPGPLAAGRLAEMGAKVLKLEPPWGDLLYHIAPDWYAHLNQEKEIRSLDLKSVEGRSALESELATADVLVLTMRPGALARLQLDPESMAERFPRLGSVAIVGDSPPHAEQSGHDLTYQAEAGLLAPPRMPRFLLADLMGAERAVQAALGLLVQRSRTGKGGWEWVSLTDAARAFRPVIDFGLTASDRILGGGDPRYGFYPTSDGWVTLAALEERLWQQFLEAVDRTDLVDLDAVLLTAELHRIFASRTNQEWATLALDHKLPLAPVPAD
jgi:crotonobetainyl-CoA:carnitine CoA-transferase CaiB-like acyl-CoA transferase